MFWKIRHQTLDLATRALVLGIVNVTPDSFSDGGQFLDPDSAITHGKRLVSEGADILDVGGESTRPGAAPVDEAEELRRILPVIHALAPLVPISVDTRHPGVAREALAAGAQIVNDISGLRDPAMIQLLAETGAGGIAMHMQGEPATMQLAPAYTDVAAEVREFFVSTQTRCCAAGVNPEQLVYDPGIGFGKRTEHNLTLLARCGDLAPAGRPILAGVSRKSFIGAVIGSSEIQDRAWPTVALTSLLRSSGVRLFRVHEVRPNSEALRMTEAILAAPITKRRGAIPC
jgi:dihydropteroate synthase